MGQESNARRFLDAFHGIEQELNRQQSQPRPGNRKNGPHRSFRELVRDSKFLTSAEREYLDQAADLRNAIAHAPWTDGVAIADPRDSVVEKLERKLEQLREPPRVIETLKCTKPIVLADSAGVEEFFGLVREHAYSQAPVSTDDGELRLITTNMVTRWIAENWEEGAGALPEGSAIKDVLPCAESDESPAKTCSRELRVVEAIRVFSGEYGEVPAAIVLTHNGKASETPLGICTKSDLPALYRALE